MENINQLNNWKRQLEVAHPCAAADIHVATRLLNHGIEAHGEIERLRAENEALRKDAERYRWLRDGKSYRVDCINRNNKPVIYFIGDRHEASDYSEQLDTAIDNAMKGE